MEGASWIRALFAFALVVGLIGLMGWALRRFGGKWMLYGAARGEKDARISVVEARWLGPKHRLLLVKRDECEHLLLLSPEGASVVESGIRQREGEKGGGE